MRQRFLTALLTVALLSGCGTTRDTLPQQADHNTRVVIREWGPMGFPPYSLELSGKGQVVLRKEWLSANPQVRVGTIAWPDLLSILAEFDKLGFFAIDGKIEDCASVTDAARSRVTLVVGRQRRTIEYDWSCGSADAKALRSLEKHIFEVLRVAEWDPEVARYLSP